MKPGPEGPASLVTDSGSKSGMVSKDFRDFKDFKDFKDSKDSKDLNDPNDPKDFIIKEASPCGLASLFLGWYGLISR